MSSAPMTTVPEELKPCPHCGTKLRRVVSKARSFDPPRDYIEWHHDTPAGPCYLFAKLGPVISSTRDDTVAENIFIEAWNRRAAISPPIDAGAASKCSACDGTGQDLENVNPVTFGPTDCLVCKGTGRAPHPAPIDGRGEDAALRTALEEARTTIVLAIAFLGRDAGSDRMPTTLPQIIDSLAKADAAIRSALTHPAPAPGLEYIPPCPRCGKLNRVQRAPDGGWLHSCCDHTGTPIDPAPGPADAVSEADKARLDWMIATGSHVCISNDREIYWVVMPRGDGANTVGTLEYDPRKAIDTAIEAAQRARK